MVELRLLDRPQAFPAPIIVIAIAGQQCLPVGDLQAPLVEPDRDALPRKSTLRIDVRDLENANHPKNGRIDGRLEPRDC